MSTLIVVLAVVFLLSVVCGGVVLFFWSRSVARPEGPSSPAPADAAAGARADAATTKAVVAQAFRWRYIALPLAALLLSVAAVGFFYRLLPAEVAYLFRSDGSPDAWLGRSTIVLWSLLPQFFLTMVAWALTWGVSKFGSAATEAASGMVRLDRLLLFMGNMVAMPQLFLFFAMLDAFSYNSYEIHILPLRVFAVIVLVAGAVALAAFFYGMIRGIWRASQ